MEKIEKLLGRKLTVMEKMIYEMQKDHWWVKLKRWYRLKLWILRCFLFNRNRD